MSFKKKRFVQTFLTFGSIRQTAGRIVLSSLLIVLISVGVLSLTFYLPASKVVLNQLQNEMELQTTLLAKEVDNELLEKRMIMQMLAEQSSEYGQNGQQHLDNIIRSLKRHPEFSSMIYSLDPTGKVAIDVNGKQYDMSGRGYVKELAAGRSIVSDPVISVADNTMIVVIGAPIMADGKAIGFYLASYPISQAVETVASFRHGETGSALMTTPGGSFIYHPDTSFILNKGIADLGIPEFEQAFAKALETGSESVAFEQDGSRKLSYIHKSELNWLVVITLDESELLQPLHTMLRNILFVGAGMVIAALVLNVLVALRIVYPIRQLTQGIDLLAQGDLTHRIPVKGKTDISVAVAAYNTAGDKMHGLMKSVSDLSAQLSGSANQLAAGADQGSQAAQNISEAILVVADSTERQTSSVQDGSYAAENIARQINGIASHSTDASTIATEASALAGDGFAAMNQLNGKMGEMGQGIHELAVNIQDLSGLSAQIGEVVGVIGNIAKQTNILALNAAIEAARSGEAGRGFSVVADEIRKLAAQSMSSAEQISGFIEHIQREINRTTMASELTVAQALQGREAGEAASGLFSQIRSSIEKVADGIVSVSAAADDIAAGTGSLVGSIQLIARSANETAAESENVSAAAQQQMASMEEIASSSAELANMAEDLRTQIAQFKL